MADSDFSDDDVENVGGGADDVPKTKYVKLISYVHDHHFLKTPSSGDHVIHHFCSFVAR